MIISSIEKKNVYVRRFFVFWIWFILEIQGTIWTIIYKSKKKVRGNEKLGKSF